MAINIEAKSENIERAAKKNYQHEIEIRESRKMQQHQKKAASNRRNSS